MPQSRTLAYSYLRFSDPSQADGDSIRRQTALRDGWLKRNPGVRLDTSLTLADPGVSGFRGEHRTNAKHALTSFLDLVERERIPKGSYLLIENMDRLSREKPVVGVNLLTGLLLAGIRVVQLAPDEIELTEDSDLFALLRGQMSQARGHDESKTKSGRNGDACKAKREAARDGRKQPPRRKDGRVTDSITNRLPAWVEDRNGKLVEIPERAEVVRRIFELSGDGFGLYATMKILTNEGVPPFGQLLTAQQVEQHRKTRAEVGEPLDPEEEKALKGLGRWASRKHRTLNDKRVRVWKAVHWSIAYLDLILKDRRALGEYQPRLQGATKGEPAGDPIPDYYPRVVSEEMWLRARLGAQGRHRKPGRTGNVVNVFQGLLRGALDGESYGLGAVSSKNPHPTLFSTGPRKGVGKSGSFPLATFEVAVLGCLKEINPAEIINGHQPDESLVLAGQLAGVEAELDDATAFMDTNGFSATIGKRVTVLEERKRELAEKLANARAEAAHPLSESWGEAKTLLGILATAPDVKDARLRLRSALRRIVDEIRLLVVPRGRDRLAAVQVFFKGDPVRIIHNDEEITVQPNRSYLIFHRPPKANAKSRTAGRWKVISIKHPEAAMAGVPFGVRDDLRDPDSAAGVEDFLTKYPGEMMDKLLEDGNPLP